MSVCVHVYMCLLSCVIVRFVSLSIFKINLPFLSLDLLLESQL